MRSTFIYTAALLINIGATAPIAQPEEFSPDNQYYPLKENGFPDPNPDQILIIQKEAHGTLPNGPPPSKISTEGTTNLKLIALNELFEVAYFTELVYNVTNKVKGYDLGYGHEYVLDSLKAIVAQEELHLLNANGALKKFNQDPIQPCKYSFPVTDFQSAIRLAGTFTDLVLGTLQDVNQFFAKGGDDGLVRAVSSVIGNEAEQEGFFRLVQKKRPSAQPFLTTATRDFAFTAIQSFVIPGSCPNIASIPLKTFGALTVETKKIKPATQKLKFSYMNDKPGMYDTKDLRLVYINALNKPVVKQPENLEDKNGKIVFEAAFPFDEFLMNGLTIAAVTVGKTDFADAGEVASATIFGPGLIEIE